MFAEESCGGGVERGEGRGGSDHAATMLPLGLHESTNPGPGSNCTSDLIPHTHSGEEMMWSAGDNGAPACA